MYLLTNISKIICSLFLIVFLTKTHGMERSEASADSQSIKEQIPYSLSCVKFKEVAIVPTGNYFDLSFDKVDNVTAIEYHWDNKPLARLMIADKNIFLQSISPNPYKFYFKNPLNIRELNVDLKGKLAFNNVVNAEGTTLIKCDSFKNNNRFNSSKFLFSGKKLVNEGFISHDNCLLEKCEKLLNKQAWITHQDCHLKDIDNFITTPTSNWFVGNNCVASLKNLDLSGNVGTGNAAILNIAHQGRFNGNFESPILHAESNGTLTATRDATFSINHYLGLKAHELLNEADIIEILRTNFLYISDKNLEINKQIPEGIFLVSDSNLIQTGNMALKDKLVFLKAKEELLHNNEIATGNTNKSHLRLEAKHLTFEKESTLKGYSADLLASESVWHEGAIELHPQSLTHEHHDDLQKLGSLRIKAKEIVTAESSKLAAGNICLTAQEIIEQEGSLKAAENLLEDAPTIITRPSSSLESNNAFLQGTQELSHSGRLQIHSNLMLRSNQLNTFGSVDAKSAHFKGDWWWLNRGKVNIENELNVDALVALEVYPGFTKAKYRTTNALLNANVLGIKETKNDTVNALINMPVGIQIPELNSAHDYINQETISAAALNIALLVSPPPFQAIYAGTHLICSIPFTIERLQTLRAQWRQLPQTFTGMSDAVPLIAQSFHLGLSIYKQIKSLDVIDKSFNPDMGQSNKEINQTTTVQNKEMPSESITPPHSIDFHTALQTTRNTLEPFFSNNNCNAIWNYDWGLNVGGNRHCLSIWNNQKGISLFANNYKIETCYGADNGIIAAGNLDIYATNSYNTNATISAGNVSIEANTLKADGTITAISDATLHARSHADVSATIKADKNIAIKGSTVQLEEQCKLDNKKGGILVDAEQLATAAVVEGESIHLKAQKVDLKKGSDLKPQGKDGLAIVQAEHVTAYDGSSFTVLESMPSGNKSVPTRCIILSKTTDLQKGSQFDVKNGAVQVLGEKITQASTIQSQQVSMHAESIALKDGGNISATGDNPLVALQATEKFTAEKGASVDICQNDTSKLKERTDIPNHCLIVTKNADLQEGSNFKSANGSVHVEAEKISQASTIQGNRVSMNAENIALKEGGNIHAEGDDPLVTLQATQPIKAEKGASVTIHQTNAPLDQPDIPRIILKTPGIDLQQGSRFNPDQGVNALIFEEGTIDANMYGKTQAHCKNITLEKNSNFEGQNLAVRAQEKITQKGSIKTAHVFMHTKAFENTGRIFTENGFVKADEWYTQAGVVSSRGQWRVDTPFAHNKEKGWTIAKDLVTNALFERNESHFFMRQNSHHNVLISVGPSISLPYNPSDFSLISFHSDSLKQAAHMGLMFAVRATPPPVQVAVQLLRALCKIKGIVKDVPQLYREFNELNSNPHATPADWVPFKNKVCHLLLSAGSTALTIKDGIDTAREIVSNSDTVKSAIEKCDLGKLRENPSLETLNNSLKKATKHFLFPSKEEIQKAQKESALAVLKKSGSANTAKVNSITKDPLYNRMTFDNCKKVIPIAATIAAPLINDNDVRTGLVDIGSMNIGFNGSSTNLIDVSIFKLFANYNLETVHGINLGVLGGINIAVRAKTFKNGLSETIDGLNLETPALIAGQNVSLKTGSFEGSTNSHIATLNGGSSLETQEINNKGTVHGNFNLKFNGQSDQFHNLGTVKSNGGTFSYQGPLASDNNSNLPTADEMTEGSGKWGTITNANTISYDTGNQDITLHQHHDVPHGVQARTQGSIDAKAPIRAQGSLQLYAGQNLSHNTLEATEAIQRIAQNGSITARSTVKRTKDGVNYEDPINYVNVHAGTSNTAYAGKDIIQTAVDLKSGKEGIQLTARGNIVDQSLACEKHSEISEDSIHIKHTQLTSGVTTYTSEGNLHIQAGQDYVGQATKFDIQGKSKEIVVGHRAYISDTANITVHEVSTTQSGWGSSENTHRQTITSQSVGAEFVGHGNPFIIESPETILTNAKSNEPIILKGDSARLQLGENTLYSTQNIADTDLLRTSHEANLQEHRTYTPIQLAGIENHTKSLTIQTIKDEACTFLDKIYQRGSGTITQSFVQEYHKIDTHSATNLTKGAKVVLGLALGLATQGVGVAVGTTLSSLGVQQTVSAALGHMTQAGVHSLLNNAANSLVEAEGDIFKAAQKLASDQTIKDLTFAAATAGLLSSTNQALDALGVPSVHDAQSFGQRIIYATPRELVRGGIRIGLAAFTDQPIIPLMVDQLNESAARTLHTALVGQIADLYANKSINSISHKLLHAGAGAVYGSIIGGKEGALAGGLGALTAEITAELLAPTKNLIGAALRYEAAIGHKLTHDEFMSHYASALQDYAHTTLTVQQISQITAALAALATGHDVEIAHQAALTALDNNFLVLAYYGITAASTAYSVFKIYQAYNQEGPLAALKQLGIEVTYNVAGHVGGSAVVRVGKFFYPSIEAATIAVLNEAPALKLLLGNFTEKLILAAEKANHTPVGKAISKIEEKLLKQHAKILNKIGLKAPFPVEEMNPEPRAILKNGYYEVNNFKITKKYYERLWNEGRPAPTLVAQNILDNSYPLSVDHRPGFFRYEHGGWELIYNPTTKEIWHIQPIKRK